MGRIVIRKVSSNDIQAIVDIYNHYILESTATFEIEALTFEDMSSRIANVVAGNLPWIVIENDSGKVIG